MSNSIDDQKTNMSLEEYQSCLLDEMSFFDKYCREHDITYYLIFGTLL